VKKLLSLLALSCLAPSAMAVGNINTLPATQADFRALSEDLSSAISYKPVAPGDALGVTGFDLGIEVTQTRLAKTNAALWNKLSNGGNNNSSLNNSDNLYAAKLHVDKGLPMGFDVGAFYSQILGTNVSVLGGEVRYAILDGDIVLPAVAVRGAVTKMFGVNAMSMDTKSLDISVSKGFAMVKPYLGVGMVWANSSATGNAGGAALAGESFSQGKIFGGINLNLGLTNLCFEMDRTGSARSISGKLGFRW
jgi:hypothetical protein